MLHEANHICRMYMFLCVYADTQGFIQPVELIPFLMGFLEENRLDSSAAPRVRSMTASSLTQQNMQYRDYGSSQAAAASAGDEDDEDLVYLETKKGSASSSSSSYATAKDASKDKADSKSAQASAAPILQAAPVDLREQYGAVPDEPESKCLVYVMYIIPYGNIIYTCLMCI